MHAPSTWIGAYSAVEELCGSMSMQDRRVVELPNCGENAIRNVDDPALSTITVAWQEAAAPVLPDPGLGVPEPISVKPTLLGGMRFEVHMQVPAGMLITSPSTTVCVGPLITALTFA